MVKPVEAILFDVGDTLRRRHENPQDRMKWIAQIIELVDARISPEEMHSLLAQRWRAYRDWCERTLNELSEEALWREWMLPDYPQTLVETQAAHLNALWRKSAGERVAMPDAAEVLGELFRRGYRLGVISNTSSGNEALVMLKDLGVLDCFETVMLSTVYGKRKPDPAIFQAAAEAMALRPESCAYVGNRIDLDVAGSLSAGFGQAVLLVNPKKPQKSPVGPALRPDHVISNLKDLLDIYPPRVQRQKVGSGRKTHLYQWGAAISSMWAVNSGKAMEAFFRATQEMGFAGIELNHETSLEMIQKVNLDEFTITSIHEPCPADVAKNVFIERDWLVSSTDEECRRQGVRMARRSINLAEELGARMVVLHMGVVDQEKTLEAELRRLHTAGKHESQEYEAVRAQLIAQRAALAAPHFDAVMKSIKELAGYAARTGVCLAIENRYHYFEIPQPDELAQMLGLFDETQVGFLYDVGHAYALEKLGFYSQEDWLGRFSERIVGVHLHDVIGLQDHFAPGMGAVDFRALAPRLPAGALRTCELKPVNTPEQVRAGLEVLAGAGCIRRL